MNALSWTLMMTQVVWSKYLDHYYVVSMWIMVVLAVIFGSWLLWFNG